MATVRIVLLSDTHNRPMERAIPEGDLLFHTGDFTMAGEAGEVAEFASWLGSLPHPRKVVVAGNHDFVFERDRSLGEALLPRGVRYLEDSGVRLSGLRIWGSPWQPWFCDWAFNLWRGPELRAKWDLVPPDTDVLLTHGPPAGILDRTSRGESAGCADLAERVAGIPLLLHAFGHIHEAHGQARKRGTLFVNASICDREYRAGNPPVVVDVDPKKRTCRVVDAGPEASPEDPAGAPCG